MKLAIKIGGLSAANVGVAFLFQWYVLIQLGPGMESDALFAGMTVPQLVLAVASGSLVHVLVPLFSGESEDRLRHDAWGFMILIGGVFGLIAVLLYAAAPWWVPLTVPGFDQAGQTLTVELTRIQLIGMVFAAINGVQWAVCHGRQRFLWAELSPLFASVFALLMLVWALPRFGVIAAAWIGALRMGVQTLFLAPALGMPVRPDMKSAAIQQAWQRIKPLLLGTAYYKTDPLVDRLLLSTASSGNLSLYYLAQQIYGAASQVLNKAITAPLVPRLSMLYKAGDRSGFRRVYRRKLLVAGIVSSIGLLALVLIGQGFLSLLVGRGNISAGHVAQLWWIMLWLGGVFVGGTVGQICSSSFYACGDTATPTFISTLTYTVYIPSKVAAFYLWGIAGLAIATSVYYLANLSLLLYFFERKSAL